MMLEESVMGFFVGAVVVHHEKPSALENLMVHKIDRFTPDRPTGPAKTGDWKDYWRDLFARRKARRAERKAERLARRSARQNSEKVQPLEPTPTTVRGKAATDAVTTFALKASPNPFAEQLRISFTLPRSQEVELLLFDLDGRKLWQQQFSGTAGDHQLMINNSLNGLPAGAYLLRIIGDGGQEETIRLIR
ncbi:T9SS type A sorting domain-containing protein [Lewinella sp. W8]|nr:T9SS type A sorting domain-containing protein [Lewinella sp. W8]